MINTRAPDGANKTKRSLDRTKISWHAMHLFWLWLVSWKTRILTFSLLSSRFTGPSCLFGLFHLSRRWNLVFRFSWDQTFSFQRIVLLISTQPFHKRKGECNNIFLFFLKYSKNVDFTAKKIFSLCLLHNSIGWKMYIFYFCMILKSLKEKLCSKSTKMSAKWAILLP